METALGYIASIPYPNRRQTMKIHTKKKQHQAWLKAKAKSGHINTEAGKMVLRNQIKDSSMRRDFYPQEGV
jgi:hypothetical protein